MVTDHGRAAADVVAALQQAHAAEDVARYAALFSPTAWWVTGRGVFIEGRDALEVYRDEQQNPNGRHRHTYVITPDDAGAWTIVAGQNTAVEAPA